MKLITWNVNGVRARHNDVTALLQREQPDVLCLQELKAAPEQLPESLCSLGDYWCYWHGQKGGYSGVALLFAKRRFPEAPQYTHPEFDHETRVVTAKMAGLEFASIYVPNGGKDLSAKVRFLDALDAYAAAAQASEQALILCGDLNVALEPRDVHPSLRKPQEVGQTADEQAQLARLISRGLVDLHRKFEPDNDRLFTWWAPWRNLRQKNVGWRIDYVLASQRVAERAVSCSVEREFGGSDHAPVTAVFDL